MHSGQLRLYSTFSAIGNATKKISADHCGLENVQKSKNVGVFWLKGQKMHPNASTMQLCILNAFKMHPKCSQNSVSSWSAFSVLFIRFSMCTSHSYF